MKQAIPWLKGAILVLLILIFNTYLSNAQTPARNTAIQKIQDSIRDNATKAITPATLRYVFYRVLDAVKDSVPILQMMNLQKGLPSGFAELDGAGKVPLSRLPSETDPTVASHIKAITTTNIANWNTAFGWGNHASAGYLPVTLSSPTEGQVIGYQGGVWKNITPSGGGGGSLGLQQVLSNDPSLTSNNLITLGGNELSFENGNAFNVGLNDGVTFSSVNILRSGQIYMAAGTVTGNSMGILNIGPSGVELTGTALGTNKLSVGTYNAYMSMASQFETSPNDVVKVGLDDRSNFILTKLPTLDSTGATFLVNRSGRLYSPFYANPSGNNILTSDAFGNIIMVDKSTAGNVYTATDKGVVKVGNDFGLGGNMPGSITINGQNTGSFEISNLSNLSLYGPTSGGGAWGISSNFGDMSLIWQRDKATRSMNMNVSNGGMIFNVVGAVGSNSASFRIDTTGSFYLAGLKTLPSEYSDSILTWNPVYGRVKYRHKNSLGLQTLDSTLGVIYQGNNFVSTSDFTNRGATVSVSGGNLSFSGGAGPTNFSQTLEYTPGTLLENWHQAALFIPTEKTSTSYGFGLGVRSTNTAAVSVMTKFDATDGVNSGKLLIYTGTGSQVKISDVGIAFNANDTIELHAERVADSIYVWAYNRNQNISGAKISYGYSFASGASQFTQNTGRFSIYSYGGAFNVSDLLIVSNVKKRPDIVIIGDSKTAGYFSKSPYDRWAVQVRKRFPNTVIQAGSADRIVDAQARLAETISLQARQYLLCIGVNDIRAGTDSSTIKNNYQSYVSSLQATGARVLHLLSLKEAVLDASWFNNYIKRTWPSDYIDSKMQYCSDCLNTDLLHLNEKGNTMTADAVINSGKIQGYSTLEDNSLNAVLAQGNTSNNTIILGDTKILGTTTGGSFSEPKAHFTSNYPSLVLETKTSSFGGASIVFKTNRPGPKVNPALFGDSVRMAQVFHGYTSGGVNVGTWAIFTADNTNNQITGFKVRQAENDFTGSRFRVTAEAGQALFAGFELPGTVGFQTTQAVFAVNAATNQIDLYNLASSSIDTTIYKPIVRRSDGRTYSSFWPVFGDALTNTTSSVDNEVVLFNSTTGKSLKRATGTGVALLTSGVLSTTTTSSGLLAQISDETGTGSLVASTSPTFITNITAPLLIGGTGTTSTLTYKTTSGVGATGADHIFQVGNNGATEALRILNNGRIGVAQSSPTAWLDLPAGTTSNSTLRIRQGVAPTSPNDGDIWLTSTQLQARINGVTKNLGDFEFGTYTPTLTNATNITSSTPRLASYYRIGNMVTVCGVVDVTPTTINQDMDLQVSIPIASNFTDFLQGGGTAAYAFGKNVYSINVNPTYDRVQIRGIAEAASLTLQYQYSYMIY